MDDDDQEYYDENDCYDADEEQNPIDTVEFKNLPDFPGYTWVVTGELTGDIKWNAINAEINLKNPNGHLDFKSNINSFTKNCGIKAISTLYFYSFDLNKARVLHYLESFCWHQCNCGLLIGSDYIDFTCQPPSQGYTGRTIQEFGHGYQVLPSVWNPNYTWNMKHEIYLFYKTLKGEDYSYDWS